LRATQPSPQFPSASSSAAQTPKHPDGKRIKITPAVSPAATPERPRSAASSNAGTPQPARIETIETFEDRTLGAVFRLTLKEEGQYQRVYLPGLRSELQDESKELRIETAMLDQALLEAASKAEAQRPLNYLLPCWKRITKLQKQFKRTRDDDPKFQVLCEAKRLCMSYCIFAMTMPEMFGYA
jgi:ubiquitin conjugation factor E4 B